MTDPTGFIRAICENPHDRDTRRIFADWLQDSGSPPLEAWAEFMRIQWEREPYHGKKLLAKSPEGILCKQMRDRAELLWLDHSCAWLGFPRDRACHAHLACWRSGMLDYAVCGIDDWMSHGPHIVQCQPVISVTVMDRQPQYRRRPAHFTWRATRKAGALSHSIPVSLFPRPHQYLGERIQLDTALEANIWLSQRCLIWARAEAGLPPLPEGEQSGP